MAQYKVPQDVEADDKLIGPFSFRQFVYLLIAAGLIALAVGLFQIFPVLVIIPLPFILLFGVLALPLKKDQPMETYLAALVSYYLKPHNRIWTPGQKESTIHITAPKIVEESRTRDITGEEATHRLSFLADIVDSEGYAIRGNGFNQVREDLILEANTTTDMFETSHFDNLEHAIARDENERHEEVMREMREAIDKRENFANGGVQPEIQKRSDERTVPQMPIPNPQANVESGASIVSETKTEPEANFMQESRVDLGQAAQNVENSYEKNEKVETENVKPSIMELADNTDFSVATIAKQANRINQKEEGEVFISLH